MKESIRELRIKIDGLAQLTKELRPQQWVVNIDSIPSSIDIEAVITLLKQNSPLIPVTNVEDIKPLEQHEISKCYDSLILAKAWLGKVLGELGESTPYANDGNRKTVDDIESATDKYSINKLSLQENNLKEYFSVTDVPNINWSNKNHIEKVDWLRCSVEDLIQEVIKLDLKGTRELAIARTNSYTHLCESKIYLGLELGRIRDSK